MSVITLVNPQQIAVANFMKTFGCYQPEDFMPQVPTGIVHNGNDVTDTCIKLIREEIVEELIPALETGDLIGVIDGLCDSIYVLLYTANAYGIPVKYFFDAVHQNNMSKVDPTTGKPTFNENGKIVKPEGFKPVDIKGLLEHLQKLRGYAKDREDELNKGRN